ncbi:Stress up-regulated Nod 19 protein [Quillaja saponaria]|uniref:Stress up-regulated Nod 19 protein n=1 Tax=Quillaja saponaria TaxID=32244 RepID=A0AAD7LFE4_QUISA|nr:Stress up-regulated Nod 19 protein [Quillaja saponaria]
MVFRSQGGLLSLAILLLALCTPYSYAIRTYENEIKSAVFLSPKFVLGPGSVLDKHFYNVDFRIGHVALKSFTAEVIDEAGNLVPLHETYIHHWTIARYHQSKSVTHTETVTHIPDPYGIEIGNSAEIPAGYEEKWWNNVHAIDNRGVEDKLGCTECRCKCNLYNVTKDEYGQPLKPEYIGDFHCCHDGTQCRIREGFEGPRRSLYLRYTVKWVDRDRIVVPLKIYILDVTDNMKKSSGSSGKNPEHDCQIEYQVKPCSAAGRNDSGYTHVKRTSISIPYGGYVIYGVGHQHAGGIGTALYGEDGRVICSSVPIYGEGEEAGNEASYIVGMSTCYPQPGSVKINDGEVLTLESNCSSTKRNTGVMGVMYLYIAEQLPQSNRLSHSSFLW